MKSAATLSKAYSAVSSNQLNSATFTNRLVVFCGWGAYSKFMAEEAIKVVIRQRPLFRREVRLVSAGQLVRQRR